MKNHTKKYLDFYGLDECDFIESELSGKEAVDIHHIDARGMGGSRKKDEIWNLQALTRREHDEYGDKKQFKAFLKESKFKHLIKFLIDKLLNGDKGKAKELVDKL